MKFRINRAAFAEAVKWAAASADGAKSTTPIMAGLLINAAEGCVEVSGFDYVTSAQASLPADVMAIGDCVVSAALLTKVTAAADGEELELTLEETTASIRCGDDAWDLATMPSYDYPTLPVPPEPVGWVEAADLKAALERVTGAVGKDGKAMAEHTGIRLEVTPTTLALAATDRNRMAGTEVAWEGTPEADAGAIVPTDLLSDFTAAATGRVGVSFQTDAQGAVSMVGLTCDGFTSTARVTVGAFPDWRFYIGHVEELTDELKQEGRATTVAVDTELLVAALRKAAIVIQTQPATVMLHLTGKGIGITGGSMEEELGKFSSTVPAQVTGPNLSMKLNLAFLMTALTSMKAKKTLLRPTGAVKPLLVLPGVEGGAWQRHLVQPLRVV